MIPLLRTVAIFNAAIWLGSMLFFAFVVAPTLLAADMKAVLTPYWAGYATQSVISKLFWIQHICAFIALLHLVAEFLYVGRPIERAVLAVLLGSLCLGLIGGFALQPMLRQWHIIKYSTRTTPAEKMVAQRSFGIWHGVSQVCNVVVLGGLVYYLWRISNASAPARSLTIPRFNG